MLFWLMARQFQPNPSQSGWHHLRALKETKSNDPISGAVLVVQCSVPFKVVEAQKRVQNENVTRIKQTNYQVQTATTDSI